MLGKLRATITALVTLAACSHARSVARVDAPPEHAPMLRGEVGERLDRYLSRAVAFGFSGAVLVADSSGPVLRKGYGVANVAMSLPIGPETVFDMGSITKQFTAAAILLLEAEGKLSTTDSVRRFFPEAPPDRARVTIHQLLTHTGGIIGDVAGDYDPVGKDSALRVIMSAPLVAPPGSAFHYSNAGYALLGAIIEQVSGVSYERFVQERLFRPAGMQETGYHLRIGDSSRFAHTYTPPVDHGNPAKRLARAHGPSWNLMANGGLLTTVGDLYRWEAGLRRGVPLSRALQAKQFAEQYRQSPTSASGYDWAIVAAEDGGIQYNHGGDAPDMGVNAEYRRYPKDGSAFILLANTRHHGASTRRFVMPNLRRLFVGSATIEVPEVRAAPGAALMPLRGWYRVDSGSYFHVDTTRGHLVLEALGQSAVNVTIFNRDSTSVRNRTRLNDRAVNAIMSLAMQDSVAVMAAFGSAERTGHLLSAWRDAESRLGRFRCARALGTDRLDRGVFITTVRLAFANAQKTVRFTWNGVFPVVNSDDADLPSTFGFGADSPVDAGGWWPYWWVAGQDTLVTFDLLSNQTLRAVVSVDAGGRGQELVFQIAGSPVRATRVAGDVGQMQEACPTVRPGG